MRETLFNIRIGITLFFFKFNLISFYIDDDPDYLFSFFQIGIGDFYERSLLSFRLDKGYSVICYLDILFFRIYIKGIGQTVLKMKHL